VSLMWEGSGERRIFGDEALQAVAIHAVGFGNSVPPFYMEINTVGLAVLDVLSIKLPDTRTSPSCRSEPGTIGVVGGAQR
jgi:hypothetical protein